MRGARSEVRRLGLWHVCGEPSVCKCSFWVFAELSAHPRKKRGMRSCIHTDLQLKMGCIGACMGTVLRQCPRVSQELFPEDRLGPHGMHALRTVDDLRD